MLTFCLYQISGIFIQKQSAKRLKHFNSFVLHVLVNTQIIKTLSTLAMHFTISFETNHANCSHAFFV